MRGQGRIFQRGGVYWIAYSHRGREFRESSYKPEKNLHGKEADAKRLLKNRREEIQGKRFLGSQEEKLEFSALLDGLIIDYRNNRRRSLRSLERRLKPIRDAFGCDRAVDVTEARIERYKGDRLGAGKAPATVNRELAAIKRAFRLAVKQKRLTTSPSITCLVEENARTGFFDGPEFEAVVAHLPDPISDVARFAALSAWRKREVLTLQWADVDLDGRIIRLRPEASKNSQGRLLALEGELWEIIERRRQARQITTPDGGRIIPWVFHRGGQLIMDFRAAWRNACVKAGVSGRLFHDLRRTAVRNMIRAGVPQSVAMKISGHKTAAIFRRYDITTETDIREAVLRTQAHVQASPLDKERIGHVLHFPEAGQR